MKLINALTLYYHNWPSQQKPILVKLLRGESTNLISVILVPSQGWGGRGLLG